eukprot:TRINITY_DN600_c1_g1_i4.p1 TRINITY_DN600_c1_g1~~TRINITY_DN600_c1_g1_i4.p1  ORF type:complete len:816 (+),score=355.10 TRINITY_DN600_c1_g1_i4:217-2448(+)
MRRSTLWNVLFVLAALLVVSAYAQDDNDAHFAQDADEVVIVSDTDNAQQQQQQQNDNEEQEQEQIIVPPEIKLLGDTELNLPDTHVYTEPGYEIISSDAQEKFTVEYRVPPELRAGKHGSYVIDYFLYNRTDHSQVLATASRTVRIISSDACSSNPCACVPKQTCACQPQEAKPFYKCLCHDGYTNRNDPTDCFDIDECKELGYNPCENVLNSHCVNLVPGYECQCNNGFVKEKFHEDDPFAECVPISKCSDKELAFCGRIPNSHCVKCAENEDCSFLCECDAGFINEKTPEGQVCRDVDECSETGPNGEVLHDCDALSETCVTEPPFWRCDCQAGYEPRPRYHHSQRVDRPPCKDLDECALGLYDCDSNADCVNLLPPDRYQCVCRQGFKDIGSGKPGDCVDVSAPEITLVNGEAITFPLFHKFIEPGYIVRDNKEGSLVQSVDYPREFGREFTICTDYHITYYARDEESNVASATRQVTVVDVNQCAISSGPHKHRCRSATFSSCEPIPWACKNGNSTDLFPIYYSCVCPPDYDLDEDGFSCLDHKAPVFDKSLFASLPVIEQICTVCKHDIVGVNSREIALVPQPNLRAYDPLPDGQRLMLLPSLERIEGIPKPVYLDKADCYRQIYTATDASGNVATTSLDVCVTYEDLSDIVDDIREWRNSASLRIDLSTFIAVILLVAVICIYGSQILTTVKVLFKSQPSWEEFHTAYTFLYRIRYPLVSDRVIKAKIHEKFSSLHD